MGTIKEHDRVVLAADLAGEKLAAGDVGTAAEKTTDAAASRARLAQPAIRQTAMTVTICSRPVKSAAFLV